MAFSIDFSKESIVKCEPVGKYSRAYIRVKSRSAFSESETVLLKKLDSGDFKLLFKIMYNSPPDYRRWYFTPKSGIVLLPEVDSPVNLFGLKFRVSSVTETYQLECGEFVFTILLSGVDNYDKYVYTITILLDSDIVITTKHCKYEDN